ncbi:hypothetical protein [Amycolatopsis arida]|uniref:hypothetical protein n=1 Tax=Amycolatopsis arida TaxID=587909 RepID=UPI001064C3D7|nr:hypothetical protein [Amycolatopsis arida]
MLTELVRGLSGVVAVLTEARWASGRAGRGRGPPRVDRARLEAVSRRYVKVSHPFARYYATASDTAWTPAEINGSAAWRHSQFRSLAREFFGTQYILGVLPPVRSRGRPPSVS